MLGAWPPRFLGCDWPFCQLNLTWWVVQVTQEMDFHWCVLQREAAGTAALTVTAAVGRWPRVWFEGSLGAPSVLIISLISDNCAGTNVWKFQKLETAYVQVLKCIHVHSLKMESSVFLSVQQDWSKNVSACHLSHWVLAGTALNIFWRNLTCVFSLAFCITVTGKTVFQESYSRYFFSSRCNCI